MRRGRVFFYLGFIIILALVAVVVVYQRFLKPGGTVKTPGGGAPVAVVTQVVETQQVVVAAQPAQKGAVLSEAMVKLVPIQKSLYVTGMYYTDIKEVAGRQTKIDLDSGMLITKGMLVAEGEQFSGTGSTAALSVPRGMVAVSLPVNRLSGVAFAPQSGDHVNVLISMLFVDMDTEFQTVLPNQTVGVIGPGTGSVNGGGSSTGASGSPQTNANAAFSVVDSKSLVAVSSGGAGLRGRGELDAVFGQTFYLVPSERQRPRMASQTLLQDVVILRMGSFPLASAAAAPAPEATAAPANPQASATPAPQAPEVVTLIVSPQDAITLNFLMFYIEQGSARLTLALRNPDDKDRYQTEAVTLQFLLDQYRIPVPVKMPYGLEPRVDNLAWPVLAPDVQPTPVK